MINKGLLFSKFLFFLEKATRKIADFGFPLPENIHKQFVKSRIKSIYSNLIIQYKNIEYEAIPQAEDYPIWVFWWQGVNNMPEVVRICYNSILQNAENHPVRLITETNYKQYLSELPHINEILKRLEKRALIYAHFSDIVRSYLLYTYGGVWIDATVLLTDNINNIITNRIFVSGRRCSEKLRNSITKGKWTSYFVFANKGNLLFKFIHEVLSKQIIEKGYILDYLMMDFCFIIAYENFPYAKEIQEQSPIYPDKIHSLAECLNKEINESQYKSIIKKNPFLKLTYKQKWFELTDDHKLTYYGFLKKCFYDTSIFHHHSSS